MDSAEILNSVYLWLEYLIQNIYFFCFKLSAAFQLLPNLTYKLALNLTILLNLDGYYLEYSLSGIQQVTLVYG